MGAEDIGLETPGYFQFVKIFRFDLIERGVFGPLEISSPVSPLAFVGLGEEGESAKD
jgi:hypothetical protein